MGDQRLGAQGAAVQGVEHGLEVALLGPAHKANVVVMALLLIGRVVAARAVGAAHLEGEFLFVKEIATELQAGHAHQHDAAALATDLGCHMNRLTGSSCGGDQHPIHADTIGVLQTPGHRINTRKRD